MNMTEFRAELRKIYDSSDVATDGTFVDTDLLKQNIDILDVVQSRIDLRKAGSSWKARCPFHDEKTGSFTVNTRKQTFKCFGCGEGGDVIKFVMLYDKCSFKEAIAKLGG